MIIPKQDNVVVKLDPVIANAGGLLVVPNPKTWRAKGGAIEGENRGTVVSVGPGKANKLGKVMPPDVMVGEVVRFSELEYPNWLEGDDTYVLISESDILWVEE